MKFKEGDLVKIIEIPVLLEVPSDIGVVYRQAHYAFVEGKGWTQHYWVLWTFYSAPALVVLYEDRLEKIS